MVVFKKVTIYIDSTDRDGVSIVCSYDDSNPQTYPCYVHEIYAKVPGTAKIEFVRKHQGAMGVTTSGPDTITCDMPKTFHGPTGTHHDDLIDWWNDWGFEDNQAKFDVFLKDLALWVCACRMMHGLYDERASLAPVRSYQADTCFASALVTGLGALLSVAANRDESPESGTGRLTFSNACFHAQKSLLPSHNNVNLTSGPLGTVNPVLHTFMNNNLNLKGLTYETLMSDCGLFMVSLWDTYSKADKAGDLAAITRKVSRYEHDDAFRSARSEARDYLESVVDQMTTSLCDRLDHDSNKVFSSHVQNLQKYADESVQFVNDAADTAAITLQREKVEDLSRVLEAKLDRQRASMAKLGDETTRFVVKSMSDEFEKLMHQFNDRAAKDLHSRMEETASQIRNQLSRDCNKVMQEVATRQTDDARNILMHTLSDCQKKLSEGIENVEKRAEELLTYESDLDSCLRNVESRVSDLALVVEQSVSQKDELRGLAKAAKESAEAAREAAKQCAAIKRRVESAK